MSRRPFATGSDAYHQTQSSEADEDDHLSRRAISRATQDVLTQTNILDTARRQRRFPVEVRNLRSSPDVHMTSDDELGTDDLAIPDTQGEGRADSPDIETQVDPEPIDADPTEQLDEDLTVDVGALPGEALNDHEVYHKLAKDIQRDGYSSLIDAAWQDEVNSGSSFGEDLQEHSQTWWIASTAILCAMDVEVLYQACAGNLAKAYDTCIANGSSLATNLDRNAAWADTHPSIYIRIFCHRVTGDSLLLEHAQRIVSHARAYARVVDDVVAVDAAYKIDRAFDPEHKWHRRMSEQGLRWFLKTSRNSISEDRQYVLLTFANTVQNLINESRARGLTYIPLLQYIGYAISASKRKRQHESFKSTNWLCMFTQALAEALWPGEYCMRTFTICLISQEMYGPIAEILLTRVTRSYYHAGGFCIDQAGKSMNSILLEGFSDQERAAFWAECQEWISDNTECHQNAQLEVERRARYHKKQLYLRGQNNCERVDQRDQVRMQLQRRVVLPHTHGSDPVVRTRVDSLKPELLRRVTDRHSLWMEAEQHAEAKQVRQ